MSPTRDQADDGPPPLPIAVQRRLGARLRAGYIELAREPLPDDHVDLLLRLRHSERARRRERD